MPARLHPFLHDIHLRVSLRPTGGHASFLGALLSPFIHDLVPFDPLPYDIHHQSLPHQYICFRGALLRPFELHVSSMYVRDSMLLMQCSGMLSPFVRAHALRIRVFLLVLTCTCHECARQGAQVREGSAQED